MGVRFAELAVYCSVELVWGSLGGSVVVCVYVVVVVLLLYQTCGCVKNVHVTTDINVKKKVLFSVTDHTGMVQETLKQ